MNKIILIGRLTKDPELTTTTSGVSICRMSLAVPRSFRNAEGERDADFFNIVVWRALGENCHKFLKKGSQAAIIGNVQNRSYDAPDGTKRYVTEVVAEEVEFLGTRNGDSEPKREEEVAEVTKLKPIDDDGLPF